MDETESKDAVVYDMWADLYDMSAPLPTGSVLNDVTRAVWGMITTPSSFHCRRRKKNKENTKIMLDHKEEEEEEEGGEGEARAGGEEKD